MNKDVIYYGVAVACNRGSFFILMPFLATLMDVESFGFLSLYMVSAQLLAPIISLNISSAITREYYDNPSIVRRLLLFSLFFSFSLSAFLIVILKSDYIPVIIFSLCESIFLVVSTFERFRKGARFYFFLCLFKSIILIGFILISLQLFEVISVDVILYCFAFSSLSVLVMSAVGFNSKVVIHNVVLFFYSSRDLYKYILFSISFLPHVLFQWVGSSADRYLVGWKLGPEVLGVYSIGYSLASLYMIVNAALALGLPQICIKDVTKFTNKKFRRLLFTGISISAVVFYLFLISFVDIYFSDRLSHDIFNTLMLISTFVFIGFVFLSYYYYYSSLLFFGKQVKVLSLITLSMALVNVVLTTFAVFFYNIEMVALATLVSYLAYFIMVWWVGGKKLWFELIFPFSSVVCIIIIYWVLYV